MENQFLRRVTITGADNSIRPEQLADITRQFPYVEWGILLSANAEGNNRFPTLDWINKINLDSPFFSGHICGKWVRDICEGNWSILEQRPISHIFSRFQLNFHSYLHKIKDVKSFVKGFMNPKLNNKQFIFQMDDVNNDILNIARDAGIDAVPLFDTSGGVGQLPDAWPKSIPDCYCGYAGGLSCENLVEQLALIRKVITDSIWIDVETRIRSEDDTQFLLDKVVRFLEISQPYVVTAKND